MARGQVQRISKAMTTFTAKQMRSAATSCLKHLGAKTPVDTGHARGNWQIGVGAAPIGEVELRSTLSMLASGTAKLSQLRNPRTPLFIVNNIEYIGKLNAGSSTQAPAGFVEAAIAAGIREAERKK